jgi:hypothetical protein
MSTVLTDSVHASRTISTTVVLMSVNWMPSSSLRGGQGSTQSYARAHARLGYRAFLLENLACLPHVGSRSATACRDAP